MSPTLSGALSYGRRVLTYTGIGFFLAACVGVLLVLFGWFPSAMVDFAEHPQYVDPRRTVLVWLAVVGICLGLLGGAMGFGIGLIPVGKAEGSPLSAATAPELTPMSSEGQQD